ncbi:MAG TPA: hypothetical protein PLH72_18440 [Vicinamibacterales bacterium]|nr:hypothetical protein [Vicinamibacterales bacterium]
MTNVRAAGALALVAVLTSPVGAFSQDRTCDAPEVRSAWQRAAVHLQRVEEAEAVRALRSAVSPRCPASEVAALALEGWVEARRLALVGGAPDALGGIPGLLGQLDAAAGQGPATSLDVQAAQYASSVVRAAVAAAQDERDEMQLYLVHAHGLAMSLAAGGVHHVWPLPFDDVAGELWLEVDRFVEARGAFAQAAAAGGARSMLGLARTLGRLGEQGAACAAYRRARAMDLGASALGDLRTAVAQLDCPEP